MMFVSMFCMFFSVMKRERTIMQITLNEDLNVNVNTNVNSHFFRGYDERFNLTSDFDSNLILKINKNFNNMKILKYLNENSVIILDKVRLIENEKILTSTYLSTPNLLAGNLFDDWVYEF